MFGTDAPALTSQAGKSLVARAYATPDGAHDSGTFIAGPLPLIAAGGDTLLVTDTRIVFERRDDGTVRQILTSPDGTPLAPPLRPWGNLGHAREHTASVDIHGAASLAAGPDGTPFVLVNRENGPFPRHFTWQGTGDPGCQRGIPQPAPVGGKFRQRHVGDRLDLRVKAGALQEIRRGIADVALGAPVYAVVKPR